MHNANKKITFEIIRLLENSIPAREIVEILGTSLPYVQKVGCQNGISTRKNSKSKKPTRKQLAIALDAAIRFGKHQAFPACAFCGGPSHHPRFTDARTIVRTIWECERCRRRIQTNNRRAEFRRTHPTTRGPLGERGRRPENGVHYDTDEILKRARKIQARLYLEKYRKAPHTIDENDAMEHEKSIEKALDDAKKAPAKEPCWFDRIAAYSEQRRREWEQKRAAREAAAAARPPSELTIHDREWWVQLEKRATEGAAEEPGDGR